MKYKDNVLFGTQTKKPAAYFKRAGTENIVIEYDISQVTKIPGKHRKLSKAARNQVIEKDQVA